MSLDNYHLDLVNIHGRQNECVILGLMRNGEESSSREWLTDEEVENLCGCSYKDFRKINQISVINRYLTDDEVAAGERKLSVINRL